MNDRRMTDCPAYHDLYPYVERMAQEVNACDGSYPESEVWELGEYLSMRFDDVVDAFHFGVENANNVCWNTTDIRVDEHGDIVDEFDADYWQEDVTERYMELYTEGRAEDVTNGLIDALIEEMDGTPVYKWLRPDGTTNFVHGFKYPEVGEWTTPVDGELVACQNGYHATHLQHLRRWCNAGDVLYRATLKECTEVGDKVVGRSIRLDERIGVLTGEILEVCKAFEREILDNVRAALTSNHVLVPNWSETHTNLDKEVCSRLVDLITKEGGNDDA